MEILAVLWSVAVQVPQWSWFCGERALSVQGESVPKNVCASVPWLEAPGAIPMKARDQASEWTVPPVEIVELAVIDSQTGKPVGEGWLEVVGAPPPLSRRTWVQRAGFLRWHAFLPVQVRVGADGFKPKDLTLRQRRLTASLDSQQVVSWRLARPGPADACLAPQAELGTFATFVAKAACVQAEKDGTIRIPTPRGAPSVVVVRVEGCRPHLVRGVVQDKYVVPCDPGFSLLFQVFDDQREPMVEAKVTVNGVVSGLGGFPYRSSCVTTEAGTCTVKGLEDGLVKISVSAPGKALWGHELSLPHEEAVVVTLKRGWDLKGKVVTTTGEPVAGATARAQGVDAAANQKGEFVLAGLPWETLVVRAEATGFLPAELTVEPGILVAFVPLQPGGRLEWPIDGVLGEGVAAEAVRLEDHEVRDVFDGRVREEPGMVWWEGLPPGIYRAEVRVPGFVPLAAQAAVPESGVLVRLPEASLVSGSSFLGTVVDRDSGEPVVGARVRAEPGDPGEFRPPLEVLQARSVVTGPDGSFVLGGLQDQRYRLLVQAPGFAPLVLSGRQPKPEGAELGTLELGRGFSLRVQVVDGKLQPRPGAEVEVREGKTYEYEPLLRGLTDDNGVASFSNLPPGRFRLETTARGCEKRQWVEGEDGEEQEVTVSCDQPRVRGTVLVGGTPVAEGRVVFAPPEVHEAGPVVMVDRTGDGPRFFGLTQTAMAAPVNHQGEFLLEPAKPGTWQARWVSGQQSTSPRTVLVPEDGELVVVLDFPGGAIDGRVTDRDGAGVANASLEVANPAGEVLAVGQADVSGRFRFSGIAPGVRLVRARHDGYEPGTAQVVVSERSGVEVEIVLLPAPRTGFQGRIVSPGAGVAGAPVVLCGAAARILYTDGQGGFEVFGLKPGQYQLCGKAYGGPAGCTSAVNLAADHVGTLELHLEGQAWIREDLQTASTEGLALLSELSCPLAWLLPAPQWRKETLLWGPLLRGSYTLVVPPGIRRAVQAR